MWDSISCFATIYLIMKYSKYILMLCILGLFGGSFGDFSAQFGHLILGMAWRDKFAIFGVGS